MLGKLDNSNWDGEENVFELAEEADEELENELDDKTRIAIITYVGLNE